MNYVGIDIHKRYSLLAAHSNGYSNTHCDCDRNLYVNPDRDRNSHSNRDSNRDSYGDANSDRDSHGHGDTDRHSHGNARRNPDPDAILPVLLPAASVRLPDRH